LENPILKPLACFICVVGAIATSRALDASECSILASRSPWENAPDELAARDAFLEKVCGGANGNIYHVNDPAFGDRLKEPHGGTPDNSKIYSDRARRMGLEGTMVLAFVVETDGSIRQAAVMRSTGHDLLDEAGVEFIEKQKFKFPATLDGQPVRMLYYLPLNFRLRH
jgi:TonB family protein